MAISCRVMLWAVNLPARNSTLARGTVSRRSRKPGRVVREGGFPGIDQQGGA